MSAGEELRRSVGLPAIDALLRSWNDSFWSPLMRVGLPATDAWIEDDRFVIRVQLPRFDKKDIEVRARDGEITITAQHHEKDEDKRSYVLRESHDSFSRTVSVPSRADLGRAAASFDDGALTVTVPLSEQPATRTLEIE